LAFQYSIRFSVCYRIFSLAANLCFPSDIVVQGHRGDIIEGIGCNPSTYYVTLAYPLVFIWPPIISFIAVVYGCLAFRGFLKKRKTLDARVTSESHMDKGYYLRLMWFSLIPLLVMLPLSLYILIVNATRTRQLRPWISWEDTHLKFNRFDRYTLAQLKTEPAVYWSFVLVTWCCPLSWVLFIIFLGTGPAHRKQYRRWFFSIARPFGIKPQSSPVVSPWGLEETTGGSTRIQSTFTPPGYSAPRGSEPFPKKLDLTSVGEHRVVIIGFDCNEYQNGVPEKSRGPVIV
jgi:pheromone a factor receptor